MMAAPDPKKVNKLDLSLDDIIKLNKRQAKAKGTGGSGKGRGRNRAQGRPTDQQSTSGQQNASASGTPGGSKSKKGKGRGRGGGGGGGVGTQQKVQRLRQKAKKLLQSKKKQASQQQDSKPITGVKLRLGTRVVPGGGGRGGGRGGARVGRGRGQRSANTEKGVGTAQPTGAQPGNRLKALRALKAQKAGTRGRGRGVQREALKQVVGRGKRKGRGTGTTQQDSAPATPTPRGGGGSATPTPRGRGRGRGGRGRGARGGGARPERKSDIEIFSPSQFEPIGVDIPIVLCAEQHTSRSLHNRFTPKIERKPLQRMVQRGGRTVNLHS